MNVDLHGVAESLLITLGVRAKDATSNKPILNDQLSLTIANQLDYDFEKFVHAWKSYYGILSRAKVMDQEVCKFCERHPNGVIISVGCGLDTRFHRIDNGSITWYNVDFPEVISLREDLMPSCSRVHNIGGSALDAMWAKEIVKYERDRDILIICEGMLMYLSEEDVQKFLSIAVTYFPAFEMHLDLLCKRLVKNEKIHDTVKEIDVQFLWGCIDGAEVVQLEPKLEQIGYINFTDEMKKHLKGFKYLLVPFIYLMNNRLGKYRYRRT